jgi:hypothetical protein
MGEKVKCRGVADHGAQLPWPILRVCGCGIECAGCPRAQSWSFTALLATVPSQNTGWQKECWSGLSSLEGAQGLRDLRARKGTALGDHG